MKVADFLRLYPLRAPNIMWFLGAGASAGAGIPTAFDMIWDFKRALYCSAQRVPIQACSDLADSVVRGRLQQYFDASEGFPRENAEDEYACYFEAAYPAEADRRRYIEQMASDASPSYGHLALAALLRMGMARIIWTTNFDRTVEDAVPGFPGSSRLITATLDNARVALEALNEGRSPLLVKLHGDFQSQRLKNVPEELREQDATLRQALVQGCKRYGLAVIGYSGRDQSVLDALEEAVDGGQGFPSGLFWFLRAGNPLLPQVEALLARASAAGVDAHVIETETFDELLADVLLLVPDIPPEITDGLDRRGARISDAPIPQGAHGWPVIRFNALPILSWPSVARRVVCTVGGTREVRDAVKASGADLLAARRRGGVVAFGRDSEVRKAFDRYDITEFDLHPIEAGRLRWESAEWGLLYEALSRGIARQRPLIPRRRARSYVLGVDPMHAHDPLFHRLGDATGQLTGTIRGTDLRWAEAARIRLEYQLGRLWLLVEPTTVVDWPEDGTVHLPARGFVRERLAGRFNAAWNESVAAWALILTGGADTGEVRAFDIGDGVDAAFTISSKTAYSHRENPR